MKEITGNIPPLTIALSWLQIKMKVTLFNSNMIYNKITTVVFCCVFVVVFVFENGYLFFLRRTINVRKLIRIQVYLCEFININLTKFTYYHINSHYFANQNHCEN